MNSKSLLISGGIVIGVLAAIALVTSALSTKNVSAPVSSSTNSNKAPQPSSDSAQQQRDQEGTAAAHGSYMAYTEGDLNYAKVGKVVLFFNAASCASCQTLDKDIAAKLDSIPEGLYIRKVDFASAASLKQKFAVTTAGTLVQVDNTGTKIKSWSGSLALSDVVAQLQ